MTIAPILLTPDFVKRLTYAKYLLQRANSLLQSGTDLDCAAAVLAAHDGSEMLMRVVTDAVKAPAPDRFYEFWKHVETATKLVPPHKAAMERLNSLRNGFKHNGNLPNTSVVRELMPTVAAFCNEIASIFMKVDLESISLADLVTNESARDKIKDAEASFLVGNRKEEFTALGIAYDVLHDEAHRKLGFAVEREFAKKPWGFPPEIKHAVERVLEDIQKPQQRLADVVNIMALGIQPHLLRRFERLTPQRLYFGDGSFQIVPRPVDGGTLKPLISVVHF
jgi:hypothetical protein